MSLRCPIAAVALAVLSYAPTARAEEPARAPFPPEDRKPAAEITVLPPDNVPDGYELKISIDGVPVPPEKIGQPLPIAPGRRSVRHLAKRDADEIVGSTEVDVVAGSQTTFRAPRVVKGLDHFTLGMGIGTLVVGSGLLGTSIWAVYELRRKGGEEGDYTDLFTLAGAIAIAGSTGLVAGGIAMTAIGGTPDDRWGEPPPPAIAEPPSVRGMAVTWSF